MRKNEILHVRGEKKEIIKYWDGQRVAGIYTFTGKEKGKERRRCRGKGISECGFDQIPDTGLYTSRCCHWNDEDKRAKKRRTRLLLSTSC
jgi:hypothetical protein